MAVNEAAFFREATLRICGSLQIEKAMSLCLQYLAEFMPADKMYIDCYERGLSAIRTIASASGKQGRRLDVLTPVDASLKSSMDKFIASSNWEQTVIINQAASDPLCLHMLERFNEPTEVSVLAMILAVGNQPLGMLILIAVGSDRYAERDAQLLSLLQKPFAIALSNVLQHHQVVRVKDVLVDDCRFLHNELGRKCGQTVIGSDFGLKGVMELVRQVARQSSPVILIGETGTGKEIIARTIHNLSRRQQGPFISVNCGAIPESLIDSELFGHEKGAFTGALSQKRGRFERADNGTIFLDEIGELSLEAQVRLLRVLQESEIERVGGTESVNLNIRIIAATHRNLRGMIKEGRFREDLFYRLNVFPISIPPLRKRLGDIPELVQHFIVKKSREMGLKSIPTLAAGAFEWLNAYPWPGNVRELENAVERALILNKGEPLAFSELQACIPQETIQSDGPVEGKPLNLDRVMEAHIRHVLEMTNGKVEGPTGAAKLLGVKPGTLRHRMRKLGIPFGRKVKDD